MKYLKMSTFLVGLLSTASVQASLILQWNNDDLSASSTSATADFVDTGVSASALTEGAGLNAAIAWPNALGAFANGLETTLANAIVGNDYFSFTLTPDSGNQVSYDNLSLRLAINTGNTSVDNIVSFYLFSDATGFTDGNEIDTYSLNRTAGFSTVVSGAHTFDMSAIPALQNVAAATEFRIYAVQTAGTGNRMAIGVPFGTDGADDLVVNGTISTVPEPTTMSLIGMTIIGVLGFTRVRVHA